MSTRDQLPADEELVGRVRSGDREAYGVLVQRHQHALYRFGRGMGLDHDTTLDVVQDTFIKGYSRLTDCRNPARIRPWLFSILRNLCLDQLKNVRNSSVSLDRVEGMSALQTANADAELAVTLDDALIRLPVALREAFLLKHDAGYSYEEIADLTKSGVSAVKMRVHRARDTLRDILTGRAVG